MQMRKTNTAARVYAHALFCTTAVAAGVAISAPSTSASDHSFPSKPITLIVPGWPGGTPDLTARALTAEAGNNLGHGRNGANL